MQSNEEIWKDVVGYEGRYQISSLGRVNSIQRFKKAVIVKPDSVRKYLRVTFNKKHIKVHRLVAMAFIPNPENKPCVNHKNGIKHDNRVENLEWVTHYENTKHALEAGRILGRPGESHPLCKLSAENVIEIRSSVLKEKELSTIFNVDISTIYAVLKRRSWRHL